MTITYSSGVYTLSSSGSYTPSDLYAYNSAGITRHNGSRIVYDFGSSRIIIGSGTTLTIDTDDDYGEIMFSDPGWNNTTYLHHIYVQSGGTLNIGSTYSQDLMMVSKEAATLSYKDENREWRIEGTLNWYGGIIMGGNLQTYSGSDGEISGYATFAKIEDVEGGSLRMSEADFVPESLRMFGGAIVPFVATTDSIKGLTFVNCATQPAVGLDNNGVSGAEFMECEDWDVSDSSNIRGFGYWDQRWAKYINQATGTDFNEPQGNLANNSNNRGLLEVRQSIEFEANNGGLAKFYTEDTDNDNRLAANQIVDNPDYEADRTYELTESSGTASYDTDGGVLIGVYWRTTGGLQDENNNFDSRGNADDTTDIFTWLKVEYGYQPATLNIAMKGKGGVNSSIPALTDNGITESTRATVSAYTGITPVYATGTLTVTVDENHTINEVYDYIKYWESENPDAVWANSKTSFISTSNKLAYLFSNLVIIVDGCTLTGSDGQILPTKPTVESGGFFEDAEGAIWEDSGSLYYASHAYLNVKDVSTSANIEGAVIGFGDVTTETNLCYNTSLSVDTLVTDASGNAEGYFVYKVDSTTYSDTKQATGEYNYIYSSIPRSLSGMSVGSSSSREVIRLTEDEEVTESKANAETIAGGLSVDATSDVMDCNDETMSDSYDGFKWLITADADIDTGLPAVCYFCLYGLPLNKSDSSYSGRSSTTIYQNICCNDESLVNMIIELDTAGTYSNFTIGTGVQINFEDDGTFDLRASTFNNGITVDTIGDNTVTARFPLGTSVTNNDPSNITVETSTSITIGNDNLVDGSRVRLYNITQDTELDNDVVSGGSGYSYTATVGTGEEVEVGDAITIYATYADGSSYKKNYSESTVVATSNINFIGTQSDWTEANALSVDGSAQTEFSADYPNIQVDVDASGNEFNVADLIGWLCYIQTTEDGIRNFYGVLDSVDTANWKIVTSVVDLKLDNENSATATQGDVIILMRDDQVYPQVVPTSGGGGIGMIQSGLVFVTETGTSGLTPEESAKLTSIYDKTDNLPDDTADNLVTINDGVKKASKLIPHNEDL